MLAQADEVAPLKIFLIPLSRLPAVLKRCFDGFNDDDIPTMAAAITYFTFFSLFPLVLLLVGLAGLFMSSADAADLIFGVGRQLAPDPAFVKYLDDIFVQIIDARDSTSGLVTAIGLIGSLFGAAGVFGNIDKSINRAWGCEFAPSLVKDRLISFAMVLGAAVGLVASLALQSTINFVQDATESVIGIVPGNKWIWYAVNLAVSLSLYTVVLSIVYRTLPRCKVAWSEVWPGALLAAILWEVLKQGFALYLGNFANYAAVYGSLGTLIALLTWIWLSAQVLLLGAEFASQYAREHEQIEADIATRSVEQIRSERLRQERLRRQTRSRKMEQELQERALQRDSRSEQAYAPPARSFGVVVMAAIGATIAAILTRLASLAWRRDDDQAD